MPISSQGELFEALAAGDFERLIGTAESSWVDFKLAPYGDTPKGKWELTKDVAAFANSTGGVIVIGVETQKPSNDPRDIASAIRLVGKQYINQSQLAALLNERIFPRIRNIRMQWYPSDNTAAAGVFIIEVPSQRERDKHFVVERMLDEESRPTVSLGVPRREGDQVEWIRAEELHRLLNDGLWLRQELRSRSEFKTTDHSERIKRASTELDKLIEIKDWNGLPIYGLQAIPPDGTPQLLPGFHEENGVRGAVMRPPSLRPRELGFDLPETYQPQVLGGGLASLSDSRRVLLVEPNGTLTVACLGTSSWLAWGRDQPSPDSPLRLNPLVLAEFTLIFFSFVHQILKPLSPSDGQWIYRIQVRHFLEPRKLSLAGGIPNPLWGPEPSLSSVDTSETTFEGHSTAGRDAHAALSWLYSLFGIPQSKIPFVKGDEIAGDEILNFLNRRG